MTIDWSKAPEGYPLWIVPIGSEVWKADWHQERDVGYYDLNGRHWSKESEGVSYTLHRKPEAHTWNGEGLPPVGAIVEVRYAIEDHKSDWPWHKGECVVVGASPEGDEFCVVRTGDVIACFSGRRTHIRPFRTPEQIAAEEREAACKQLCIDAGSPEGTRGQMETAYRLYDAGYRKQVAP